MASTPSTQSEQHPLLRRPLYVYDLPKPILTTLILKAGDNPQPHTTPEAPQVAAREDPAEVSTATSCTLCGFNSTTVADQRAHAKSDFHHFNVKRRTRGEPAVGENEWETLIDQDLNESISGSDTDGSSGHEDDVATLLRKKAVISSVDDQCGLQSQGIKRGAGKAPLIWFTTPQLPGEVSLGVYRALFSNTEQEHGDYLTCLRGKQLDGGGNNPHIFMCMIGGGHFAAMIVSLLPKIGRGDDRQAHVLASKTFHRYTTRRKQGGSQAASDASKGAAHSAGSSLRRHNEAALTAEVRELLASWKDLLESAALLFVRASGTNNRRTLFGYDGAVLRSNDPRVRGFPFSTRRATQSELMRSFIELTRLKISRVSVEALLSAAGPQQKAPKPMRAASPAPPQLTLEEEAAVLHTTQLTALVKRSKIPALLSYLSTNSLPATYHFFPASSHHHAPTILHLAASLNASALVTALLTKPVPPADPTVTNPDSKTPFDLAGDRPTRDAFRIVRASLGEAPFDWAAAHVPAALTKAEATARDSREREEADKEEKARRQKELQRLAEESTKSRKVMGGKPGTTLGGMEKVLTGIGSEGQLRGLTPEARVRLERERRARAAEERIKKITGGKK